MIMKANLIVRCGRCNAELCPSIKDLKIDKEMVKYNSKLLKEHHKEMEKFNKKQKEKIQEFEERKQLFERKYKGCNKRLSIITKRPYKFGETNGGIFYTKYDSVFEHNRIYILEPLPIFYSPCSIPPHPENYVVCPYCKRKRYVF